MTGSLEERLQACVQKGSKTDRSIASFMLSQLTDLPFETAASLAAKIGCSEPSVGRFCRSLGFLSLKGLKEHLKQSIGERPWLISDRLKDFQARARSGEDHLARGLELEMGALVQVYETAHSEGWLRAVKKIAHATAVHVAGFQTERGMAQIFVNQLQYLRGDVHLLDLAAGNFSDVLLDDRSGRCLVMFEARRYSRMAQLLARDAKEQGIYTVLITDPFCDWGRELVDEMFVVPTQFNLFWESTAQMASLANLLVNSVFVELGPQVEQRMNRVSQLYNDYTGYVGDASGPHRGGKP